MKNLAPMKILALVLALSAAAFQTGAQQPGSAPAMPPTARGPRQHPPVPPLFFKEEWTRPAAEQGQVSVAQVNVVNPNLELKLYGGDAKNVSISGSPVAGGDPLNVWTGMANSPVAVTLRDRNNFVNLTGLAKIKWLTRASAFHVVRPVVKLADGTVLVGDHADASTTTFLDSEFTFTGLRWIKLDPLRVVTTGVYGPVGEASSWIDAPDLSKVDEVGFVDLMPGSGHGSGGWINVGRFEVYGLPVKR
jgi:hypothetical protein